MRYRRKRTRTREQNSRSVWLCACIGTPQLGDDQELEGLKALAVDDAFNTCDSVTKMSVQVGMRPERTLFGKEAVLRTRHHSYCLRL